jgi:hypothetical protein
LVKKLATENTLFFPMTLEMNARSSVHSLGSDCELHVAGTPVDAEDLAGPPAVVVESPNLCKNKPAGGGKWEKFFDDHVIGETCQVKGFPRIYDEHLAGEETETNPHHMLEIHPAVTITCGPTTIDATGFLTYYDGMSEIQPSSAAECFSTNLEVRKNTRRIGTSSRPIARGTVATSPASRRRCSPSGSVLYRTAVIRRSCESAPRIWGRRRSRSTPTRARPTTRSWPI